MAIRAGSDIHDALLRTGAFPVEFLDAVEVGEQSGRISETLLTRDFTFAEGMAPLEIAIPPAALAGTCDHPARGPWDYATIDAIPQKPGLPTRTCQGEASFRFIGLAPGEYSLRFRAEGCEPRRVDNVIVRKGETTWLEEVSLRPATPKEETAP